MINELRFSGLASGIDTESMIEKLMNAERIPLDKMYQQKQRLEWQRDAYREMNSLLLELRNMASDMRLQGTYLAKKATSSNETIVKVTANSNAVSGVHTIEVKSIAKGVSASSTNALGSNKDSNGNIITSSLAAQFGITGTISFTLNGQSFTYDTSSKTIYDVVNDINNANIGLKASYDKTLDRFFLNSTSMGSNTKIDLQDTSGFFKNELLFEMDPTGDQAPGDATRLLVNGKDAEVVYNNSTFFMITNQFTINGLQFDLVKEAPGTVVNINVSNDVDTVYGKIVNFVNKYNEIIEKINSKISEPRYRDYPPLTEKQKEEMTEKQIELWEEKAKSGILQGDSILSSALSQFRRDFAETVSGLPSDMDSLFDLGFKTGSYEERGKIIIDESKLREALASKPEKVMDLFTKSGTVYSQQGIAQRLYNSIDKVMDQITDKAGSNSSFSKVDNSYLGKALDSLEEQMDQFEEHLKEVEDRYWRQFTAMEQAIQRANMQSAWLMQQFGGGMPQG